MTVKFLKKGIRTLSLSHLCDIGKKILENSPVKIAENLEKIRNKAILGFLTNFWRHICQKKKSSSCTPVEITFFGTLIWHHYDVIMASSNGHEKRGLPQGYALSTFFLA